MFFIVLNFHFGNSNFSAVYRMLKDDVHFLPFEIGAGITPPRFYYEIA
jgi:hypothetical protein